MFLKFWLSLVLFVALMSPQLYLDALFPLLDVGLIACIFRMWLFFSCGYVFGNILVLSFVRYVGYMHSL